LQTSHAEHLVSKQQPDLHASLVEHVAPLAWTRGATGALQTSHAEHLSPEQQLDLQNVAVELVHAAPTSREAGAGIALMVVVVLFVVLTAVLVGAKRALVEVAVIPNVALGATCPAIPPMI
jgi:hypothetical protein